MKRKSSIGILLVCFLSSSANVSLAAEVISAPPVIVFPYQIEALNKQVLNQDRANRDEEIALRALIEENARLTQEYLTRQKNAELAQITQTMQHYRDGLMMRDRMRIEANGRSATRYSDLVALHQDVDADKATQDQMQAKSRLLEEKYRFLTQLRDEMIILNDRLKKDQERGNAIFVEKEKVIEGFKRLAQQQQSKIQGLSDDLQGARAVKGKDDTLWQMRENRLHELTQRLLEQDKKIAELDDIIKQKDEEIARLKNDLGLAKDELKVAQTQESNPFVETLEGEFSQDSLTIDQVQISVSALKEKLNAQVSDLKLKDTAIAKLKKDLADAKDMINSTNLSTEDGVTLMDELKGQVKVIQADFDARLAQLDQFEIAFQEYQAQLAALNQRVAEQGATLAGKDAQIKQLKADLNMAAEVQSSLKEAKSGYGQMDDLLKLAQTLIDKQQQQIALLNEKENLKDTRYMPLEKQVDGMAHVVAKVVDRSTTPSGDNAQGTAALKEELAQKEKALAEATQELSLKEEALAKLSEESQRTVTLEQQLAQKVNELTRVKEELVTKEAALKELATQTTDIEGLRQKLSVQADELEQSKKDLALRQEEMDATDKEVSLKEGQLNELKGQIKEMVLEGARMATMLDVYQDKLKSKNEAYDNQLASALTAKKDQAVLEGQITDLNNQLQSKQQELDKVKQYFYELEQRYSAREQDIKAKDLSLSMMQQLVDQKAKQQEAAGLTLEQTVIKQTQEIATLRQEGETIQQRIKSMAPAAELVALKESLAESQAKIREKEIALAALKEQTVQYPRQSEAQLAHIERLKTEVTKLQDQLKKKSTEVEYKAQELARLKERSRMKEKELTEQLKDDAQDHRDTMAAFKSKLVEAEKKVKVTKASAPVAIKKEPVKAKDSVVAVPSPVKEKSVVTVPALAKGKEQVVIQYRDNKAQQAQLTAALAKLEEQKKVIARLEERIAENEARFKQSTDEQRKDLKEATDNTRLKLATSQEELKDNKVRIARLQKDLNDRDQSLKESGQEMVELRNAYAEIQEKLKSTAQHIKVKDDQVQELSKDPAAEPGNEAKEVTILKEQIKKQTEEIMALKKAIEKPSAAAKQLPMASKQDKGLVEQLRQKVGGIKQLQQQLNDKTKINVDQQKTIERISTQLAASKGEVNQLRVKLGSYSTLKDLGLGNQGYLVREGKNMTAMMQEINSKISRLQEQLDIVNESRHQLQVQYDVMSGNLNEARAVLQACLGKVVRGLPAQSQMPNHDLLDVMK